MLRRRMPLPSTNDALELLLSITTKRACRQAEVCLHAYTHAALRNAVPVGGGCECGMRCSLELGSAYTRCSLELGSA